jgi:hypothetical protein
MVNDSGFETGSPIAGYLGCNIAVISQHAEFRMRTGGEVR